MADVVAEVSLEARLQVGGDTPLRSGRNGVASTRPPVKPTETEGASPAVARVAERRMSAESAATIRP